MIISRRAECNAETFEPEGGMTLELRHVTVNGQQEVSYRVSRHRQGCVSCSLNTSCSASHDFQHCVRHGRAIMHVMGGWYESKKNMYHTF